MIRSPDSSSHVQPLPPPFAGTRTSAHSRPPVGATCPTCYSHVTNRAFGGTTRPYTWGGGHAMPCAATSPPSTHGGHLPHRPSISRHVNADGPPGGRGPRGLPGPPTSAGAPMARLHLGTRKGPPGSGAWPDPGGPFSFTYRTRPRRCWPCARVATTGYVVVPWVGVSRRGVCSRGVPCAGCSLADRGE